MGGDGRTARCCLEQEGRSLTWRVTSWLGNPFLWLALARSSSPMRSGFRDSLHPARNVVGVRGAVRQPEWAEPTKLWRVLASTHGTLPNAPIRPLGMAAMARRERPGSFCSPTFTVREIRSVQWLMRTALASIPLPNASGSPWPSQGYAEPSLLQTRSSRSRNRTCRNGDRPCGWRVPRRTTSQG